MTVAEVLDLMNKHSYLEVRLHAQNVQFFCPQQGGVKAFLQIRPGIYQLFEMITNNRTSDDTFEFPIHRITPEALSLVPGHYKIVHVYTVQECFRNNIVPFLS